MHGHISIGFKKNVRNRPVSEDRIQEGLSGNSFTWKLRAVLLEVADDTVLGNTKLYG